MDVSAVRQDAGVLAGRRHGACSDDVDWPNAWEGGRLHGKDAVRDYWRKILERRPDLRFEIGQVFVGVDSIALEYRVGDLHGIEFMTLEGNSLISFAVGNDAV